MNRKGFIGGSDIAAVMGVSRWCTPLQLWAIKTGKLEPKDLSDNEAVELGSELEDFVAKKFERKTGLKVRRAPQNYVHKAYPFLRCQVDRLIQGTDELLEVKTCSAWKAKEWEGEEIPQEYICQVMWQLGITGRSKGHIAVLIGGQAFRYKEIPFDKEFFEKELWEALKFWDMVNNETPPMAMGDDNYFIAELYPNNDEQIQALEEFNHKIGLRQQLINNISEMKKEQDLLDAQIKQAIGENLGLKTSEYLVTWKKQHRASYVVKESDYRVLRVRKEKNDGQVPGVG